MRPAVAVRGSIALLRRVRTEWPALAVLGAVVALVVAIATGLPLHIDRAAERSLERRIEAAPPEVRGLRVEIIDRLSSHLGNVLEVSQTTADASLASAPERVAPSFGPATWWLDFPRYQVIEVDGMRTASPTYLTLRVVADLDAVATTVGGQRAAPTDAVTVRGSPITEIGLTPVTADQLGVGIGSELVILPDPEDLTIRRTGLRPPVVVARVAELVELTDPAGPEWFGDARLHRPITVDTATGADVYAFGALRYELVPPSLFGLSVFTGIRLADLRPGALTYRSADALDADLRRYLATSDQADPSLGDVIPSTRLTDLIEAERRSRTLARSLTGIAVAGLGVLGLVTVSQVVRLGAEGRRRSSAVARGRGASSTQLVAVAVVEAMAVSSVAAALGIAAGAAVVERPAGSSIPLLPGLAVGAVAVATAGVLAAIEARSPLELALAGRQHAAGDSRVRIVAELVVVAVAVAGVLTLRRRGVALDGEQAELLVLLAPAAIAGAGVVVLRRVVPAVARVLAARSGWLGVGGTVGLRQAADDPAGGAVLLAVVVLAAAPVLVTRSVLRGVEDAVATSGFKPGPVVDAVAGASWVVGATSSGLALVGLAATVLLTGRRRRRQGAVLGAVGAPAGVPAAAIVAELAVPLVAAAITAALVGSAVVAALHDRVDLEPVSGVAGATVSVSIAEAAWVALAVIASGVAASSIGGRLVAGRRVAEVLREEGTT